MEGGGACFFGGGSPAPQPPSLQLSATVRTRHTNVRSSLWSSSVRLACLIHLLNAFFLGFFDAVDRTQHQIASANQHAKDMATERTRSKARACGGGSGGGGVGGVWSRDGQHPSPSLDYLDIAAQHLGWPPRVGSRVRRVDLFPRRRRCGDPRPGRPGSKAAAAAGKGRTHDAVNTCE